MSLEFTLIYILNLLIIIINIFCTYLLTLDDHIIVDVLQQLVNELVPDVVDPL